MRRMLLTGLGILAASAAAVLAGGGVAQGADNVARSAVALSSHAPCTLGSGPDNAVDGAASNVFTDKWCVPSGRPTLTLQLTGSLNGYAVTHVVVKHAGVAGEHPSLNTRAFRLFASTTALSPPAAFATVTSNTANVTTHPVGLNYVSQIQLRVDLPTQTLNQATRIYEVEVWGTRSALEVGVATGNVVQLPVTLADPIKTCSNSVLAGLIAVAIDGTQTACV